MIFCDESGFTGTNLLDEDQPSFSYVSNNFSKEEALELLAIFDTGQTKSEVKFSKIKKLKDVALRYEKFFTSEILTNDRIVISLYNKEFYLITKFVDTIIEPILYRQGYDLYKDRMNLKTSLFLYFVLQKQRKDKIDFLNSFNNLIRYQNVENLEEFKLISQNLMDKTNNEKLKNILAEYHDVSTDIILKDISADKMYDTITTAIYEHINVWGKRKNLYNINVDKETKLLDLYIDHTKSLAHESFADCIKNMKANVGDRIEKIGNLKEKYLLPLPVQNYNLVNSKDFIQIQVSDLLAGYYCYVYNNKNNLEDPLVILSKKLDLEYYPMVPEAYIDTDFETEDGPNLVDSYTNIYIKRMNI